MRKLSNSPRPIDNETIYIDDRLEIELPITCLKVGGKTKQIGGLPVSFDNALKLPKLDDGFIWQVIDMGEPGAHLVACKKRP